MAINAAEQSVLRQQEYYRLKTEVESPGSIYEIDVSTKAIYIGPDSDISEVLVQYLNPQAPNSVETAVVSLNGPFVGRLDSMLKTKVPTTGQPGRLLVSPVDIVDNAYRPASIAQRAYMIPAKIDLIAALSNLPDIPSVRADRTLRLPSVPFTIGRTVPPEADDGSTDLLIPIYGRRMVTITAVCSKDLVISVALVTLQPGLTPVPRTLGDIEISSTIPATSSTKTAVIRASDAARQGMTWLDDGTRLEYYAESDQPSNPSFADSANPNARGMADLLYLNVKAPDLGLPESLAFCDLFVKLSDRET